MYKESTIKESERRRRTTGESIETIISSFNQPLPVEIDWFWSVSKNKTALQQLFTKWVLDKIKSEQFDKTLFLGGSHKKNDAMSVSFVNGLVGVERLLECTHEEADDQIFPCTPRNKDRKLWKSCYCISWHIYLYPHYIISANWSTLIWKSYSLFQVEEIREHSSPFMISPMI